ncbi:MAG: histidine kinase dimerization/phospho-acceptor domain-containing protein [Desulfuromonadaceae bacterium]|nr:histidine kinase dimerization/phospho-acceptor domain-containing protein [Desulfuromonas sp.]MDY0184749.1 histidine kinase dimerization/phospho-acceptor domain-containing protein [Desulfuromonadaceae bacterium]
MPASHVAPLTVRSLNSQLWYVLVRFLVLSLFLGGTVFFALVVYGHSEIFSNTKLVSILSLYLLQIGLALVWLLRFGPSALFVQIQIVWDLTTCAAVVCFTGGMYSDFAFLFIFVILTCGLISTKKDVLVTLLASIVLYGGLTILDFYGFLPLYTWQTRSDTNVFYMLFLNFTAFVFAAFIGAVLSSRLQQYAQKIEEQQREHVELESFNQLILQNITSGLILTDSWGRILLINQVAQQICAISESRVLNLPVSKVLPGFRCPEPQERIERAEFNFTNADGIRMVLGYSSTPIRQGESTNILFMFQDLTQIKSLEKNLRREEHLAAIGSLSAGLAHEIRNPLASLGGSVQLLREQAVDGVQQRLLNIIARETERLNNLVNDFLNFANPRTPFKKMTDIHAVLDDIEHLMRGSEQFNSIDIRFRHSDNWYEYVDEEQIRQVIWNLLVNASNFCATPGIIECGSSRTKRTFWIDDNGPGIDKQMKDAIFEPFRTTRATGTGLGLSIAHALAKANGAALEYAHAPLGGARFKITFSGASQRTT